MMIQFKVEVIGNFSYLLDFDRSGRHSMEQSRFSTLPNIPVSRTEKESEFDTSYFFGLLLSL